MLAAVLCAACTLTTSLDGYVGQEPLLKAPDAAREAGRAEGGTDAAAFTVDGETFLAVANSLDASLRFRTDSCIYRYSPR